jgi:hypothetical protein
LEMVLWLTFRVRDFKCLLIRIWLSATCAQRLWKMNIPCIAPKIR